MEPQLPGSEWTNFVNGLGVIFLGIVTAISGVIGYRKLAPGDPPASVSATMIDTKMAERLVQSFESLARVIDNSNRLREEANRIRADNTEQLKEDIRAMERNNQLMERMMARTEEAMRGIGDLTHQIRRNTDK
jgi:hypothetical protein